MIIMKNSNSENLNSDNMYLTHFTLAYRNYNLLLAEEMVNKLVKMKRIESRKKKQAT